MNRNGAAFGLVAVTALSILASGIGFVFQVLLAGLFGAASAVDSYLFAISVPTFLAALFASALSYMIVPALVRVESEAGARAALLRRLGLWIGAGGLGFALLGLPAMLLQPLLIPTDAELRNIPGLPAMIALGWAIGGAQVVSALFTIELNAARRPITAALLALPPNLGAIAVLLLGPHSILSAPAGVLVGTLLALGIGSAMTWRSFRPGAVGTSVLTPFHWDGVQRVGWTLAAMSCFSAYAVIDAFWGPRAGSGTLASLGYSQRLIIGFGGLIVAGPSAILVPRFAARLRDDGGEAFMRQVVKAVAIVGLLAGVGAAVLAISSDVLIEIAFGRGAFGSQDVQRVSAVFRTMLPGFCAMLMSVVLTRAIFCMQGTERAMAMAALTWSALYATACGLLLPAGAVGFGVSYSAAWFAYLAFAIYILRDYARRVV